MPCLVLIISCDLVMLKFIMWGIFSHDQLSYLDLLSFFLIDTIQVDFSRPKHSHGIKLISSRFVFVVSRLFHIGIYPHLCLSLHFWSDKFKWNIPQYFSVISVSAYDDFIFFREINFFSNKFDCASIIPQFYNWLKCYIV